MKKYGHRIVATLVLLMPPALIYVVLAITVGQSKIAEAYPRLVTILAQADASKLQLYAEGELQKAVAMIALVAIAICASVVCPIAARMLWKRAETCS